MSKSRSNIHQPGSATLNSDGVPATVGFLKPPLAISINRKIQPPPMLSRSALTVSGLPGDWLICQTLTSHEKAMGWDMVDLGIAYCLPYTTQHKSGDRFCLRSEPIFPGYIFLRGDPVALPR